MGNATFLYEPYYVHEGIVKPNQDKAFPRMVLNYIFML